MIEIKKSSPFERSKPLNLPINSKIIKDRCGTVSFKRGEAFLRAEKVAFTRWTNEKCEAVVSAAKDFHVTIEALNGGGFQTACTCPKLASIKKECQHVAAVLLAIMDSMQRSIGNPNNQALSNEVLRLFNSQPLTSSKHQLHFEKREVLPVSFHCQVVRLENENNVLGLNLEIGDSLVKNIREILLNIKAGVPTSLFNSSLQCFTKEEDAVIQKLIRILDDEAIYLGDRTNYPDQLIIPPSSFEGLITVLQHAQDVTLKYDNHVFKEIRFLREPLSLRFHFTEEDDKGCFLKTEGLESMVVLTAYNAVLSAGKIIPLKSDDCRRLTELKRMLIASRSNAIPIAPDQVEVFLDKVVPGLRKLGRVVLSEKISKRFNKTPLVAKLFLDRVKNRLLAGIEFHYDQIVINPLDSRDLRGESMIVRDRQKEQAILHLIEESEFASTEEGYFLHNEELEYQFLYHVLPSLQKLVQVYATTAVRNRIFREPARPKISVKVKKERTNWLEFKFEMDGIPESQIRELLSALEEKRKYYRLRNGSLLSLESREFEDIQRFLQTNPVQPEDLEQGLNVPLVRGFKMMDTVQNEEAFSLEHSFRQFLEEIRNPDSKEFEVPENLDSVLRDYQKHGYRWMKTLAGYGFGGILADDMGLGKTLQSIAFIESELDDIRHKKSPVLVVCPSSLTYNWLSELMKFAPHIQAVVVDGTRKERENLLAQVKEADVVITSYPLLRRDINWFASHVFHTVFFDEAQAFKNPLTQTARAVKRLDADYRFALTGTPVENSLEELWSIFHVVFPELFMGLREYSFLPRKTIARRIRPFLLRRLKEEVLEELPEKVESLESVELLPEQKKLYAAYLAKLRHDTLKHLNKDTLRKNKIRILAGLTRLRQICCHPSLFVEGYKGGSAKFNLLLQLVEESQRSGRRVLIFSQFTKMLELIGRELAYQGLPYFYLDGQTPSEERVERCERFNAGECDFFLISLKAGGTGLNLTGADTVILYDLWWNPAVEEQAADRAHRMGQKSSVQVIKLLARGTVEDKMNELQDKKRHLIEEIIDPDEKVSAALTDEDIREILSI
jgi:SNF2 family DNA or RNA helicase